jgi:hypothetical protein
MMSETKREFLNVWPKTEDELLEKIREYLGQVPIKTMEEYEAADQETRTAGYNESAEAMWKVALAAFNYASEVVGASAFQASHAALTFYGQAMHLQGPYLRKKRNQRSWYP